MKKITLALILALSLVATLAMPVFAGPVDGGSAGSGDAEVGFKEGDLYIVDPNDPVDPADPDGPDYNDALGMDVDTGSLNFGSQEVSSFTRYYDSASGPLGFAAVNEYAAGWGFSARLSEFKQGTTTIMQGCQIALTIDEAKLKVGNATAGSGNANVNNFTLTAGDTVSQKAVKDLPLYGVLGANWKAVLKVYGGTAYQGDVTPAKITWYFTSPQP